MTPAEIKAQTFFMRWCRHDEAWAELKALLDERAAEELEACAVKVEAEADKYEKDGEPGMLGLNCWGWRDIAKRLRGVVAAIRVRNSDAQPR